MGMVDRRRCYCDRRCKDAANRIRNGDAARSRQAVYRAENRVARSLYDSARPSRAEERRAYYSANKLRFQQARDKRRALKVGTERIPYTAADWRGVLRQYRHACAYCGSESDLEMEHIVPLARGGRDHIGNLVPACSPCNRSKHSKFLMEWRVHVLRVAALRAA